MFGVDNGWTVVEQNRRPSPLQSAGRSLARSASVGSASSARSRLTRCPSEPRVKSRLQPAPVIRETDTAREKQAAARGYNAETEQSSEALLQVGAAVRAHGLEAAPALNGLQATCERFDESSGRWHVKFHSGEVKALKPQNLQLLADQEQRLKCERLSMHRRHRRVESTLQSVGSAFDPTVGLEAAAAALAQEELAARRRLVDQLETCSTLAQPRAVPETPAEDRELRPPTPTRAYAEQQAYFESLARPRPEPDALDPTCPAVLFLRTASEQRVYFASLAQSRSGTEAIRQPWRDELAERANALVPDEVAAAQALLTEMRKRAVPRGDTRGGKPNSRPSSAISRSASAADGLPPRPARKDPGQGKIVQSPERDALAVELRAVVEEVLWAALLQVRCCKNPPGARASGANAVLGGEGVSASVGLEDRLGNLLISEIGPSLRPVARRILGPGMSLARRIRQEFPRLSTHLGFRESDDTEPPPLPWNMDEISVRLTEVRACRDRLLNMDLTKTVMSCFKM